MAKDTARRAKPSLEAMQAACYRFNATKPIGRNVRVWPGAKEGPGVLAKVLDPGAHVLGDHTAVVQFAGGCIALSHVELVDLVEGSE
jgi:hypothetical protein